MRKFVSDLLSKTECILSTGYSFLFVTDIENKTYVELYEQRTLDEGFETDFKSILLDEEHEVINTMHRNHEIIRECDFDISDTIKHCRICNAVQAHKNELKAKEIINSFTHLSEKNQELVLKECKKIHSGKNY